MEKAEALARVLFPTEAGAHGADGTDCRAEIGREGQPCRCCEWNRAQWEERLQQVRDALVEVGL